MRLTSGQQRAVDDAAAFWVLTSAPGTGKSRALQARHETRGGEMIRARQLSEWCAARPGFELREAPIDPVAARQLWREVARAVAADSRFAKLHGQFRLSESDFGADRTQPLAGLVAARVSMQSIAVPSDPGALEHRTA